MFVYVCIHYDKYYVNTINDGVMICDYNFKSLSHKSKYWKTNIARLKLRMGTAKMINS